MNGKLTVTGEIYKNFIDYEGAELIKGEVNFRKNSKDNKVIFGDSFKSNSLEIAINGKNNVIRFGANVKFQGKIIVYGNKINVEIGQNTTTESVYILCRDAGVKIGKNCMFSRDIEIRSSDTHKIFINNERTPYNRAEEVIIGDHVWIAAKAFVSKGSHIPSGSIVGACSFVGKKFTKENCILAGVPAKIIKENISWER